MAKRITVWSLIGSLWTVFYLCLVVIVTIPDYPRTHQLWYNLCFDPNGYFHSLWYLTIGYLSGMAVILVTRFWMALASFLETIERVLVLPDGKIAFVRKKRMVKPRKVSFTSGDSTGGEDTSSSR